MIDGRADAPGTPLRTPYVPLTAAQLDVLDRVSFVRLVDDALRPLVSRLFRPLTLRAGEVVVEEATLADALYVVSAGAVDVVKRAAPAPVEGTAAGVVAGEVALDRLTMGRVFGEVALLEDRPRIATVRAGAAGAEVLRLDRDAFRAILEVDPQLADALAAGVRWSRVNSVLRGHPAFSVLPVDVLIASLEQFEPVELAANSELAGADDLFVVESGRLLLRAVEDGGPVDIGELGPADFFGESAALGDGSPVAVRALTDSRLFRLARADFTALMAKDARFAARLRERAAERDEGGTAISRAELGGQTAAAAVRPAASETGAAPVSAARRLQIEIDQTRRERAVAEITESDFFAALQSRAEELRRQVRADRSR